MAALRVGFVGWRGMVGSVLMQRMVWEKDFRDLDAVFFSTSNVGGAGPSIAMSAPLEDANDVAKLKAMDVVVSCQGGDYTQAIHPKLRAAGWTGYWIDAASALRMKDDAVIILDPVNREVIDRAWPQASKDFIGGNCTVSLMLMAMTGLLAGMVEWVTAMTYQAASGAPAQNMRELVEQMGAAYDAAKSYLDHPATTILDIDRVIHQALGSDDFPKANFGYPLACNVLPWIDKDLGNGQSREEWKAMAEANKILGLDGARAIPIDGVCVRVGAMRSHSQALTVKLKRDVPLAEIEGMLASAHEWVKVVPNTREASLAELTPAAASGKLVVPVGRLRKLPMGGDYLAAFTVGDQLLWGAAEPLRRMLRILLER